MVNIWEKDTIGRAVGCAESQMDDEHCGFRRIGRGFRDQEIAIRSLRILFRKNKRN